MDIAAIIVSIIENLFMSGLSAASMKCVDRIKYKRFRKQLRDFVHEYTKTHDGTVLTTGDFERFLRYYHPLEHAFYNISGEGDCIAKDQFIAKQIELFGEISSLYKADYLNRSILKEFLTIVYDKIENFYKRCISRNERYLAGIIKRVESSLKSQVSSAFDTIDNKLDCTVEGIESIKALLKKQNELNQEEARAIFSELSKAILKGNINEVQMIAPLLKGKSTDLEIGINYYLDLFHGIAEETNSLSRIESIIVNIPMRRSRPSGV